MSDLHVRDGDLKEIQVSAPLLAVLDRFQEIEQAIRQVLVSGQYLLGKQLQAFEEEFCSWLGIEHAIGVANGTDALELALRALDLPAGSRIAIPTHTASATAAAVSRAGLVPMCVDISPETWTIDTEALERLCEHQATRQPIRGVIAVHLYGAPCDMDEIRRIASRFDVRMVEDCAQSHGAKLRGRPTGTLGDVAAFSCYPTKNLAALGDAGIVVTSSHQLATRVRELRQYGWRTRYVSDEVGMNSRMDEIQAAALRIQLQHLEQDNKKRRANAERYLSAFRDLPLEFQSTSYPIEHCYHQFVFLTPDRDRLRAHLLQESIQTSILYPTPIHLQPAYRRKSDSKIDAESSPDPFAVAERVCQRLLCLPVHPFLTEEQRNRIMQSIREFYARHS